MITFLSSHSTVLAAFGVGVLDLIFAIKPDWQSNGVLHWILIQLQVIQEPKS